MIETSNRPLLGVLIVSFVVAVLLTLVLPHKTVAMGARSYMLIGVMLAVAAPLAVLLDMNSLDREIIDKFLEVLFNCVTVHSYILYPFIVGYHCLSGSPGFLKRCAEGVKATIRFYLLVGGLAVAALCILLYTGVLKFSGVKGAILSVVDLYGTLIMALTLGSGLVRLPLEAFRSVPSVSDKQSLMLVPAARRKLEDHVASLSEADRVLRAAKVATARERSWVRQIRSKKVDELYVDFRVEDDGLVETPDYLRGERDIEGREALSAAVVQWREAHDAAIRALGKWNSVVRRAWLGQDRMHAVGRAEFVRRRRVARWSVLHSHVSYTLRSGIFATCAATFLFLASGVAIFVTLRPVQRGELLVAYSAIAALYSLFTVKLFKWRAYVRHTACRSVLFIGGYAPRLMLALSFHFSQERAWWSVLLLLSAVLSVAWPSAFSKLRLSSLEEGEAALTSVLVKRHPNDYEPKGLL